MSVTHRRSCLKSKENKTTHIDNDYNDNFMIFFFTLRKLSNSIFDDPSLPAIKVQQDTSKFKIRGLLIFSLPIRT
jgi:hypothetical protein